MSASDFRVTGGQMVIWGVMLLGFYGAYSAGQTLGEGDFSHVIFYILMIIWVLAALTVRHLWWIPLFWSLALGLSSSAGGFKMSDTDMAGMFSLSCILAMACMNNLSAKKSEMNLGVFFYLTLLYVALHSIVFCVDNYFGGDTQFKNIAKLYYGALFPLIFLLLMDRYAQPKGMSVAVNSIVLMTFFLTLVGIIMKFTGYSIRWLTTDIAYFIWAGDESSTGYLRWTVLPILMMSICIRSTAVTAAQKGFNAMAVAIFFLALIYGGGRSSLLGGIIFFVPWLAIRGKWRQVFTSGWLLIVVCALLFIIGHTIDKNQLENLPKSVQSIQRSFSIFFPTENSENLHMEGSDAWHKDLREGSWDYAHQEMNTIVIGNGFKGWDDSINMAMFTFGEAYYSAVKIAIRMGASETLFFSTLAIFGWVGVLLYFGFMIEMMRRYVKVLKFCPKGTLAHALCEFSFCNIFVTMVISPIAGSIPSYNMIFWIIGFIAAKPYLGTKLLRQNYSQRISPALAPNPKSLQIIN